LKDDRLNFSEDSEQGKRINCTNVTQLKKYWKILIRVHDGDNKYETRKGVESRVNIVKVIQIVGVSWKKLAAGPI
jgi:hypothetical protein